MSVKVTIDESGLKDRVVEPFDVYIHDAGDYYVALKYNSNIYLHELSSKGNVWCDNSTFDGDEMDFRYVGKLSEVVVTP